MFKSLKLVPKGTVISLKNMKSTFLPLEHTTSPKGDKIYSYGYYLTHILKCVLSIRNRITPISSSYYYKSIHHKIDKDKTDKAKLMALAIIILLKPTTDAISLLLAIHSYRDKQSTSIKNLRNILYSFKLYLGTVMGADLAGIELGFMNVGALISILKPKLNISNIGPMNFDNGIPYRNVNLFKPYNLYTVLCMLGINNSFYQIAHKNDKKKLPSDIRKYVFKAYRTPLGFILNIDDKTTMLELDENTKYPIMSISHNYYMLFDETLMRNMMQGLSMIQATDRSIISKGIII